jgi:hypothetical protein
MSGSWSALGCLSSCGCNARRFERRHVVADADGGVDERDREGCTGPLAEPEDMLSPCV